MATTAMKYDVDIGIKREHNLPEMEPIFDMEHFVRDIKSLRWGLNSTRSFIKMLKKQLKDAIELEQELNKQLGGYLDNVESIRGRTDNNVKNAQNQLSDSVHLQSPQTTNIYQTVVMPVFQEPLKQLTSVPLDKDVTNSTVARTKTSRGQPILESLFSTSSETVKESACSNTDQELGDVSVGKHVCEMCGSSFNRIKNLRRHIMKNFCHPWPIQVTVPLNDEKATNDTELGDCKASNADVEPCIVAGKTDQRQEQLYCCPHCKIFTSVRSGTITTHVRSKVCQTQQHSREEYTKIDQQGSLTDKRATVRQKTVLKDDSPAGKGFRVTVLEGAKNIDKLRRQPNVPAFLHQCPKCRLGFAYKNSFQRHLARDNCQASQKPERKRTAFGAHGKEHGTKCKIKAIKKDRLGGPLLQGDELAATDRIPVCFTCGKTDVTGWSKHRLRSGGKDRICLDCEKLFVDCALLNSSECEKYTGESCKRFVCVTCKKSFESLSGIWRHMRSHTRYQPHICEKCGNTFATECLLKVHILSRHLDKSLDLQCEFCWKTSPTEYHLSAHIRQTHSKKALVCTVCGKAFGAKSHLDIHMRYHTDDRRYACNVCQNRFHREIDLQRHMVRHTGEKPYKCPICAKRFKWSRSMNYHRKTLCSTKNLTMMPNTDTIV